MARTARIDVGGEIYHVINRANNKAKIFHSDKDYIQFERLLQDAKERIDMRILAFVLMPNHWHIVLHPKNDGDVSKFMQWLTLTHAQKYRAQTNTVGFGHLYQGRYKSFLVQKESYLLQLIRYVERNPYRAKLVTKAEEWKWGSAYIEKKKSGLLSDLPIEIPLDYSTWLNETESVHELANIRMSVNRSQPYGEVGWKEAMVKKFNLDLTIRNPGRPRKTVPDTVSA